MLLGYSDRCPVDTRTCRSFAEGATLWAEDGREILDFASGVAVTNVGHNHPAVVAAAHDQVGELMHAGHNIALYPSYVSLAERLVGLVGKDHKVFYGNSGAEAIEAAVKLALRVTGRPGLVAFTHSFHGRTIGATALSASAAAQRAGYFSAWIRRSTFVGVGDRVEVRPSGCGHAGAAGLPGLSTWGRSW